MNVLKIRAQLRRDSHLLKDEIVDPDMKGPMVGAMRAAFGGDEERTIALAWLFDYNDDPPLLPKSSKDLTEGQWAALKKWIDADPDNKFEPSEDFKTQAVLVAKMSVNVFKIDTENLDVVDPGGMLETALLLGGKENKNGEEQSD